MAALDNVSTPLPAAKAPPQWPEVKRVDVADLTEVLGLAANDMRRATGMSLFFGVVYALGGLGLVVLFLQRDVPFLIYPTAMGFALLAPFFAAGLYDISRRLEAGEPLSWSAVLSSIWRASGRDLGWMAFVTAFTFIIWMDIAAMLTFAFMGFSASSVAEFIHDVFMTPHGLLFLIIGNVVGALIAFFVFSISVISFPMLYDRDIDFVTAMVTSVRLVLRNKKAMLGWALTISFLMAVSILSCFLGLVFSLPLLGHASWHLYRRAVVPAAAART